MLKIETIKNAQVFYGKARDGSPYRFKAWQEAYLNSDGVWEVGCTDEWDYCYTFDETDELILYPAKELDNV